MTALIDKYEIGLNNCLETFTPNINNCLSSAGSHASISKIIRLILKDTIVYDKSSKSGVCCNIRNVWTRSNTPFIFKGLLKSLYHKYLLIASQYYNNLILNSKDGGVKELYNSKSSNALKIYPNLQNASYI